MNLDLTETFSGNRAKAGVRLHVGSGAPVSGIIDLAEWGGYRLKFPSSVNQLEAVLLNTGGGMAGGDTLDVNVRLNADAALTVTTQSAERIYRTHGPDTAITVELEVGANANLAFIPQETILFSHARLSRTITAEVAQTGQLLLAEMLVLGRAASGERITEGALRDRWRIRHGGRLLYADDVRIDGGIADKMDHRAIGAGAGAAASLIYVAPDAADRLDETRRLMENARCRIAASAWNGVLAVRALGDARHMRQPFAAIIAGLSRQVLPRVWSGF